MRRAKLVISAIPSVALVIPTYNGSSTWMECVDAIVGQTLKPDHILVIDSGSTDSTRQFAQAAGFDIIDIRKDEFDHGGTRQLASDRLKSADVLVYLTQDAIFNSPDSLLRIVSAFSDQSVGMAVGRQSSRAGAGHIEAHARAFNYPPHAELRTFDDKNRLGIKVAFASNSFAAYDHRALESVGGFPSGLILGEDTIVAARMLKRGLKVAYVAGAEVRHSHDYSVMQEFRRYFDTGAMHQEQAWLLTELGKPEGEGLRFVVSEMNYLISHAPWLMPEAMIRTLAKYFGYKLGQRADFLPYSIKRHLSMHHSFWTRQKTGAP